MFFKMSALELFLLLLESVPKLSLSLFLTQLLLVCNRGQRCLESVFLQKNEKTK